MEENFTTTYVAELKTCNSDGQLCYITCIIHLAANLLQIVPMVTVNNVKSVAFITTIVTKLISLALSEEEKYCVELMIRRVYAQRIGNVEEAILQGYQYSQYFNRINKTLAEILGKEILWCPLNKNKPLTYNNAVQALVNCAKCVLSAEVSIFQHYLSAYDVNNLCLNIRTISARALKALKQQEMFIRWIEDINELFQYILLIEYCVTSIMVASSVIGVHQVAIADSEGILQVFSVKKDDIQLHFKTLPGPPIASLKIAGASGTTNDKIFIAAGNEIKGYTKKGKLFLAFDSGMTESINSMFVLGNELFLCGRHVFNHFRDCKDVGSYLCGDSIVDVIAFYMTKTRRLTSLIACEGRMIRVLEHARVTSSMEVESSPTVLHIYEDDESKTVLFGTVDGRIGILDVENLQGFKRWLLTNEKNPSPIQCMDSYNMSGNGSKNLILGRQDGNVEIYYVNVLDEMDATYLVFVENCNESITSLQCGVVTSHGYDEVLAVTYSGRIFGLTAQATDANFDGATGSYVFSSDASTKIGKLRNDIEELQAKVSKERERYQTSTMSSSFMELSAISVIPVNSTFTLDRKTATYTLILEAPTAIDNILIECNLKVDLLDVEKNTAVISCSESAHSSNKPHVLATYRCQINTNRIELKIQTSEGEKGVLQAYVSPVLQPKCSRLLQFDIKALSLHYRVNEFSDLNRPYSTLKLTGTFSLAEVHNWISQCLPEVPERAQVSNDPTLFFQSSILDTVLICVYKKGEAEFQSDNIMTLCILKEFLSVEATKKKAKIDISLNINDDCVNHVLKIIEPKLRDHKRFLRDKELHEALAELEIVQEENAKYLSEKYKALLQRSHELADHFKTYPDYLDRLYDSIINLYISYNKLKGIQQGRQKIDQIKSNLHHNNGCSYEDLLSIFRPNTINAAD